MGELPRAASWLRSEVERAVAMIDKRDSVREEIFRLSREVIRCSGRVVTYLNAMDISKAVAEIGSCGPYIESLVRVSHDERDLVRYGLPLQAFVEYCEAIYLLMVMGGEVGSDLARYCGEEAPPEARLLAIGDLVGEIRRHVINLVTEWKIDDAVAFMKMMRDIYSWVKYLDYPDSLVPGFRHKVDVMRRAIEDLESMLGEAIIKRELMSRIEDLRKRISG